VKLSIQKAQFLLLVGSTSRALKRPWSQLSVESKSFCSRILEVYLFTFWCCKWNPRHCIC
jgi:hypothetical protein